MPRPPTSTLFPTRRSSDLITKNIRHDKSGTKIPISGNIDDPKVEIGATIINIFRNAFIKAYEAEIDNTISLRSEEHTSELQSRPHLVCRLLLEKKNTTSVH